ncbi:MAG: DUF459 domain-containing protein [Acidimicrobiia bacterium]
MASPTTRRTSRASRSSRSRWSGVAPPVAPADEPPRRPMPAGHVLLVGIVCLFVGSLLNAPGIEKTAQGQPIGWRRDVGRAFAEPLADVSHFLHTDRPRLWLQSALGREGDDEINVSLPSPTTLPPSATTTTIKMVFAPDDQMRVWVGGDSLAIIPGQSVLDNFPGASQGVIDPVVNAVDGQVATGLSRPEILNWPEHLKDETKRLDPDIVILTLGSNDDQPLTNAPGGETIGQDNPDWVPEYRRRIGGLMDQVTSGGRTLILVGIPIVRDPGRSGEYQVINTIYKEEAQKRRGRVLFVDTYPLFLTPEGAYSDYLPNAAGELVRYREGDGIHLTRAGGDVVSEQIFKTIAENFDIISWREEVTTPPTTTAPATSAPATGAPTTAAPPS